MCLDRLLPYLRNESDCGVSLLTYPGAMGADVCARMAIPFEILGSTGAVTTGSDTKKAAKLFSEQGLDLILFAGGDGTARDIVDAVPPGQLVLGIPCGVKMHSGVFAINPGSAGIVLCDLITGNLVSAMDAEVRDVDEEALREGQVRTRHYGELCVPAELRYLQQTKSAGQEVEALVVEEIVADVIENMSPDISYLIGPGTTTGAIMKTLGISNTLLGVDLIRNYELVQADVTEAQLFPAVEHMEARIVISVIGGQGHLLGRGNQQISPRVLRAVGLDRIIVVATKTKLEGLQGRPLIVDTGDPVLDKALCGIRRVITGYEDSVLLRVTA